jgi:hypothetical protein
MDTTRTPEQYARSLVEQGLDPEIARKTCGVDPLRGEWSEGDGYRAHGMGILVDMELVKVSTA